MSDNCDNIMNPATKGIQYDPSYDTKGKAMTASNGLPAGYEGWEEVTSGTMRTQDHIRVRVTEWKLMPDAPQIYQDNLVSDRVYVRPKPKPTLPDVKPGAVIRYVDKAGKACRAVFLHEDAWDSYASIRGYEGLKAQRFSLSDSELLHDVNADGFTVELPGL